MRNTQCTAWSASGQPPRVQGAETLYRVRSGTASQKAKAVNVPYNRLAAREGRPSPLERLRSSWIFELIPSSITCPFCSVFTSHTICLTLPTFSCCRKDAVKTCLPLMSLTCENVPGSPSAFQIGVQRSRVKSLRAEEGEPGTEANAGGVRGRRGCIKYGVVHLHT